MRTRLRKLAVALAVVMILFGSIASDMAMAFVDDDSVLVDVFTQQEPYGGRGQNAPSDAFGPESVVYLYALVTFNDVSVENVVVAFNVKAPNDDHFTISARTNTSGLAVVNFTILTPPINISESEVFGYWQAVGSVQVGNQVVQDTLSFRVDWIIELLSVRTVDENLTYQGSFGRGGDVGLRITLRSIAMTLRNTTIAVVVEDELNVVVNFSMINDFAVQPDEKVVVLYYKATLVLWAHVGIARVYVSALTAPISENGVPYCPSIYADFTVKGADPVKIDFHDAATVIVLPSAKSIIVGQDMTLKTMVRNEGSLFENFTVATYFDEVLLGTFNVTDLAPYATLTLNYVIDSSLLTLGNHTISAHIPAVAKEADLTDNDFTDIIEVKPKPPIIIHDIGIINLEVSNNTVFIGDIVRVNVTVANNGNQFETFNVTGFYDSSVIGVKQLTALAPASQMSLTLFWDTSLVAEGSYQLSAFAPLLRDANVSDNTFVDGIVQVKTPPSTPVHDVAITMVKPTSNATEIGEVLGITVIAKNFGDVAESFNVTAYCNSSLIGTILLDSVASGAEEVLSFHWDTQDLVAGNYTISAEASVVPSESNLGNNRFTDGTVQLKERTTIEVHDVAVTAVVPHARLVYIGDTLKVNVTVKNNGTETESFKVVLYYGVDIDTGQFLQVNELAPDAELLLTFSWNTQGVAAGDHNVSAAAKLLVEDANPGDNKLDGGIVRFAKPAAGLSVPDWFYWFLLLLLLLILLFLLLFWYYRRRKESKASFYAGWTAWYYSHEPRTKPRKT